MFIMAEFTQYFVLDFRPSLTHQCIIAKFDNQFIMAEFGYSEPFFVCEIQFSVSS